MNEITAAGGEEVAFAVDLTDPALVRGVERNRRVVITPFALRLMMFAHWLAPRPIAWLLFRTGWRRPESK